jgi:hypothetical protein
MLKRKAKDDAVVAVSLAELVASAKASADLDPVVAGLDADIERAKRDFASAIERQADLSVDPAAASDAVIRSERLVTTLSMRRQDVARKRDELSATERRAAVEAGIAAVHAEQIPGLEASWKRLHSLLSEITAACRDIEARETAIENANAIARQNDRVDLVRRVRGVRDGVAGQHRVELPELLKAVPVRGKGESDDAFALRVGNVGAMRTDFARRHELFATAGTAAVEAITRVAVDDPDIRTALRMKMRRHDKMTPLRAPPGAMTDDPHGRAELAYRAKQGEGR